MMLTARGFADDLGVGPAQSAEVNGECDAPYPGCRGRSASFANGYLVANAQRQWNDFPCRALQHFAIGIDDEVIFKSLADNAVPAGGLDRKVRGGTSLQFEVKVHRERSRVERWT